MCLTMRPDRKFRHSQAAQRRWAARPRGTQSPRANDSWHAGAVQPGLEQAALQSSALDGRLAVLELMRDGDRPTATVIRGAIDRLGPGLRGHGVRRPFVPVRPGRPRVHPAAAGRLRRSSHAGMPFDSIEPTAGNAAIVVSDVDALRRTAAVSREPPPCWNSSNPATVPVHA